MIRSVRLKFVDWLTVLALVAGISWAGCAPSKKIITTKPQPAQPQPAPYVPPVPSVPEAPIHLSVAYPVPDQWRPAVDSNFIFGTTGNSHAQLTINGTSIPVWKNGAFLAFLPMPVDGQYHLEARRGTDDQKLDVEYRARAAVESHPEISKEERPKLEAPQWMRIIKGSDTLQTGNDVAPGALTPDGNREWFFPKGCNLHVVEQQGKYYKIELDKSTFAWVADSNFEQKEKPSVGNHIEMRVEGSGTQSERGDIFPSEGYVDLSLPSYFHPFQITAEGTSIRIHLYGAERPGSFNTSTNDPLINNVGYDSVAGGIEYTVLLAKPVWGYKAFYNANGSLDVRIRRPPKIDRDNPLKGIRIMLDPGHPPGGAIGPTGLTEREANMAEALPLKAKLEAAGATVLMTHTNLHGLVSDDNQVEELDARTQLAVEENVDLYVSLHNNAFPDGTDPFLNYGTTTYYYRPFSAPLAAALDAEIVPVTGIPNLGSRLKSLAVCRPTWMPCALTESLYMMFPDEEAELRDPAFLDKLAEAHLRGIEDFLRQRAE